jgi:hypothetical protein
MTESYKGLGGRHVIFDRCVLIQNISSLLTLLHARSDDALAVLGPLQDTLRKLVTSHRMR